MLGLTTAQMMDALDVGPVEPSRLVSRTHTPKAQWWAEQIGRRLVYIILTLSLAVWGWTPFLLWLAALATTFQLALRIRNIAEHACTTTGSQDPFTHARTTYAGWIARATVAPYWVNYHAEHHLFMGVPCYRLPAVHAMLGQQDKHPAMTIAPNYRAVLRQVTAKA